MRLSIVLSLLALISTSCGPLSPEYYQPPGPTYIYYKKPGATKLDVMKAMLECGMASPDGSIKGDMNTFLLADWCMEKSGFVGANGAEMTMEEACKLEHNAKYPACQPGAEIPKPSVERRLNSAYCRRAREMIDPVEYRKCMKEDAANPLDSTTAEDCAYWYKDLRPECLP